MSDPTYRATDEALPGLLRFMRAAGVKWGKAGRDVARCVTTFSGPPYGTRTEWVAEGDWEHQAHFTRTGEVVFRRRLRTA